MSKLIVDAMEWYDAQFQVEWSRDYRSFQRGLQSSAVVSDKYMVFEDRFYRNPVSTPALEAAVKAFSNYVEQQQKKERKKSSKMQFNEGNGGGGIDSNVFLKLNDKESVGGVFRGDPYTFKKHWLNNRSETCSGECCAHCAAGNKPGFTFRINFVTKENDVFVAKVWEKGWNVYTDLKALHEGDYPLDKNIVRISRHGAGRQDTKYKVMPIPNGAMTPEKEAQVSEVKLHDLKNLEASAPAKDEPKDSFDDIPF